MHLEFEKVDLISSQMQYTQYKSSNLFQPICDTLQYQ